MKTAPAQSHAERATTLASLPHQLQLAMLEYHSLGLNVEWLKSALDDGHFDVNAEDGQKLALEKFSACAQFLTATEVALVSDDPEFGRLPRSMAHLVANPWLNKKENEGFAPLYARLVAHLVDQVDALQKRWPARHVTGSEDEAVWAGFDQAINATFAKSMVACIALGLDDSLRALARTQPAAMDVQVKIPETLGEGAWQWDRTSFVHGEPAEITPYAAALFFSRPHAMQALVDEGFKVKVIGSQVKESSKNNPCAETSFFDVLEFRQAAPVMGLPTAFKLAIEHRRAIFDHENDEYNLHSTACESLDKRNGKNALCDYRDAFNAVGAFEFNPRATVYSALKAGNAIEIQRLKGEIEWRSFASSEGYENNHFIMEAMANAMANNAFKPDYEDALLAVLDKVERDGEFDFVFGPLTIKTNEPIDFFKPDKHDVVRMQPVAKIIETDFSRAVAKMMDLGLDVKRSLAEGALPLIEYAEQQGAKTVVGTMRAHMARTAAHSLLDEMDEPKRGGPR